MNVDKINRKYGEVLTTGRVKYNRQPRPDRISTGSLALDWAIGGNQCWGGIYRGLVTSIWGEKEVGKTTLTNSIITQAQQQGLKCGYADVEAKYNFEYALACGVDIDDLMYLDTAPPGDHTEDLSGEQIITIAESMIRSGEYGLLVFDSMTALCPKREQEGLYGEAHFGLQARLISQAMRRLKTVVRKYNLALLLISQARANTKAVNPYSPRSIMPGPRALKHQSAVIIKLAHKGRIKHDDEAVGGLFTAHVQANQVSMPYKTAVFAVTDGMGLDQCRDVLSYAGKVEFLLKKGSWFSSFNLATGEEVKMGQGEHAAVLHLRENPEILAGLREKIMEVFGEQ